MLSRLFSGPSLDRILRTASLAAAMLVAAPVFAQRSTPVQVLHPAGAATDQFGQSVAIDGDTMIVGARLDDVGANGDQGSAHVYRWAGSGWVFEATLTASNGAPGDNFGISVALFGDTAIVGADQDDVGANFDQGSAYVFTRTGTTWTQQAQLTAPSGAVGDYFGTSVAVFGDTALVGAPLDDVGPNFNQGSVYVFTRAGSTWSLQAQLIASGGEEADLFGNAVALSGDTALVGSYGDDVGAIEDQGSAYVFVRTGTTWTQQARLTASGGATTDLFGISVALSGDTALVGAHFDDVGANSNQGSAFVFTRTGTTWTQQAQLTASGGSADDLFGISVALSGDTALVGAYADDVGTNAEQGSAYVFTRTGSTWTQQTQLTAPDGATNDQFGLAVALSGDTALVGAHFDDVGANTNQGSAWVFSRVGSRWIGPDLQLLASNGATNDVFGVSVAFSGDTAVVGAYFDDVGAITDQGSAYVFVRSGTTWIQQAQLTASDGVELDAFGFSVAIAGDTVIVGVPFTEVGFNFSQGSAYVFTRSGSTWTEQAKLNAPDGESNDWFGWSVALGGAGDTAIIGAPHDGLGFNGNLGSAYVFVRSGTTWTQQTKITASDGAAGDELGISVALSGDTAIIGARGDNAGQGSAYVFVRSGTTWSQQANLAASIGASGGSFGAAVTISGDTALVGASNDTVGANIAQGSAYIFTRSGTTWTKQAQLIASDGAQLDRFGVSVALGTGGTIAMVGANQHDVGANIDQGSAYVFTRSGTTWTQQAQLAAADGAANDNFGLSIAISGDTAIVGNPAALNYRGSVRTFDVPANDFLSAHNDVTDVSYPTLAAALVPATSGQQITATEGAWRTATSFSTAGRRLSLPSGGDIRTPSTAAITLGGSSTLGTPAGGVAEIFGPLSVPTNQLALVSSDSFRLGSRGRLRLFSNASLSVDTPAARFDAPVQLDSRASLDLRGNADTFADLTAAAFADVSSSGVLTNFAAWSITSASVGATSFNNREALTSLGTSGIFGDFLNDAGAITTIVSGRLFVVGALTNNGTIVGSLCSNCIGGPPNLDVGGSLVLGPDANLLMPFNGSLVHVGGNFDCAINSNTRYHMSQATLQLEGTGGEQTLEVMSTDIGADPLGLDRTIAGNYPVGILQIGPSPSTVRIVDAHDNDGLGQNSCEALYVDQLIIEAGSRLINPSCRIYYNTLANSGTVDNPENLIPIGRPCFADYNQDGGIDGADVQAFFADWELGLAAADVNQDGGVDGADVDTFFGAWEAGAC
ncbi:MAG: hypothetical protein JSR77_02265 [Planctomycetes bacterium]|nr:hypothetical protein [Planctomycetota bacterium]